jgi:hypothetical protein
VTIAAYFCLETSETVTHGWALISVSLAKFAGLPWNFRAGLNQKLLSSCHANYVARPEMALTIAYAAITQYIPIRV